MIFESHDINRRNQDLLDKKFLGIIEGIDDPRREGRAKVRVISIHEGVEVEDLPWAYPKNKGVFFGSDGQGGSISIPKVGALVGIQFNNGNHYSPEYYSLHELSAQVKEELQNEYEGSHIILFDGDLKIWYTQQLGLNLELAGSRVNIRPDNTVYLEHAGGKIVHIQQDQISLGKEGVSDEPAVLGNKNVDALNAISDQLANLCTALTTYATAQAALVSSVAVLAPLGANLTALNTQIVPIVTAINSQIKTLTIPQTRSASVSLDGPSQLT
jgi:hypothetical protein